jgi:2-amino-4-hydroxy-6-hydroxymethyldihydropteridine diphosphokinase
MNAWIGLGGNLGDTGALIRQALLQLDAASEITVRRRSGLYRSAPWGIENQPDFINAVAELETGLQPHQLLEILLQLESELGRQRIGRRWGPRCIDLDLLTYDVLTLHTDSLELPHPRMHLRAFVLVPLLELEPGFDIPGVGKAVDCLAAIDENEVKSVVRLNQSKRKNSNDHERVDH